MNPRSFSSVKSFLHSALVARLGGADVVVVGEAHAVPEGAELRGDLIGKVLRAAVRLLGGALESSARARRCR